MKPSRSVALKSPGAAASTRPSSFSASSKRPRESRAAASFSLVVWSSGLNSSRMRYSITAIAGGMSCSTWARTGDAARMNAAMTMILNP